MGENSRPAGITVGFLGISRPTSCLWPGCDVSACSLPLDRLRRSSTSVCCQSELSAGRSGHSELRNAFSFQNSHCLSWLVNGSVWDIALENITWCKLWFFWLHLLHSPEYPESFSELQQEHRPLESTASSVLRIASRVVLLILSLAFLLDVAQRLCLLKRGCSFGIPDPYERIHGI